mmetsp:Transcript_14844/g.56165  ORF Transcript_14844/g.56165 Transcript_14844/m.56165 type:complete len:726 (+) Transcript_14844:24911-27088(+)
MLGLEAGHAVGLFQSAELVEGREHHELAAVVVVAPVRDEAVPDVAAGRNPRVLSFQAGKVLRAAVAAAGVLSGERLVARLVGVELDPVVLRLRGRLRMKGDARASRLVDAQLPLDVAVVRIRVGRLNHEGAIPVEVLREDLRRVRGQHRVVDPLIVQPEAERDAGTIGDEVGEDRGRGDIEGILLRGQVLPRSARELGAEALAVAALVCVEHEVVVVLLHLGLGVKPELQVRLGGGELVPSVLVVAVRMVALDRQHRLHGLLWRGLGEEVVGDGTIDGSNGELVAPRATLAGLAHVDPDHHAVRGDDVGLPLRAIADAQGLSEVLLVEPALHGQEVSPERQKERPRIDGNQERAGPGPRDRDPLRVGSGVGVPRLEHDRSGEQILALRDGRNEEHPGDHPRADDAVIHLGGDHQLRDIVFRLKRPQLESLRPAFRCDLLGKEELRVVERTRVQQAGHLSIRLDWLRRGPEAQAEKLGSALIGNLLEHGHVFVVTSQEDAERLARKQVHEEREALFVILLRQEGGELQLLHNERRVALPRSLRDAVVDLGVRSLLQSRPSVEHDAHLGALGEVSHQPGDSLPKLGHVEGVQLLRDRLAPEEHHGGAAPIPDVHLHHQSALEPRGNRGAHAEEARISRAVVEVQRILADGLPPEGSLHFPRGGAVGDAEEHRAVLGEIPQRLVRHLDRALMALLTALQVQRLQNARTVQQLLPQRAWLRAEHQALHG